MNFGKIGLYQPKERVMNITNIGTEVVLLDWVNKTTVSDELRVSYNDWLDDIRQAYPELWPKYLLRDSETTLIDRFTDKQRAGIFILPGKTITLTLTLEGVLNSVNGK